MKKKRFGIIFLISILLLGSLTGCIEKLTPKKLVIQMQEELLNVTSFANEISVDVKLEDVVHVTEACMDMTMESTLNPNAGHAKGSARIKIYDTELESPMEIYQVTEDGKQVIYSGLDQQWQRSVEEATDSSGISISGDMFQNLETMVEQFRLADELVIVDEKECYEIYGEVKGAELKSLVGEEIMYAYGIVEIPEKEQIDELMVPVTIDIYKELMLPARIHVDMTDEMNEFYDQIGESMNVNDFSINLQFQDYNQIETIVVPEEIKQATM